MPRILMTGASGGIGTSLRKLLPPIAHEPTSQTGLRHVAGALSMARLAPGSAKADFFILTTDIPGFDDLFREPVIGPAGLYLWVDRDGFTHVRTTGLGSNIEVPSPRVAGEIRFLGREVVVESAIGTQVAIRNDPTTDPPSGVSRRVGAQSPVDRHARRRSAPT